jgi:hypothetical protein
MAVRGPLRCGPVAFPWSWTNFFFSIAYVFYECKYVRNDLHFSSVPGGVEFRHWDFGACLGAINWSTA